jgi:hypothetical protein
MDEVINGFPSSDKFSNEEEVIANLVKLVYWLANENKNPDNVMMSFDEIVGELFVEVVKGLDRYKDLPQNELEAVIRRMMDNRISELKYRYYITHRKHENSLTVALADAEDDPDEFLLSDQQYNPASISTSLERVRQTRGSLSNTAQKVFDVLIFGDERLNQQLRVSTMRARFVYKDFKVIIRPHHVADALLISEKEVLSAYDEIRSAYAKVRETL